MRHLLLLLLLSNTLWGQEEDFDITPSEDDQLEAILQDAGDEFFDDDELQESEEMSDDAPEEITEEIAEDLAEDLEDPLPPSLPSKEAVSKEVVNLKKPSKSITIGEFNIGKEEKILLGFAKKIGNKISSTEWDEIVQAISKNTYTIVENDTLWSVSKALFGTGFYYSKLWSLNPYITNPHQIEPGMVLTFSLGGESEFPEVKFGKFSMDSEEETEDPDSKGLDEFKLGEDGQYNWNMLSRFSEASPPPWLAERKKLIEQGLHVETASNFTYSDLFDASSLNLIQEYKNYTPPSSKLNPRIPETFDELGFDRSSIIRREFKSGFYLNTFVVSNIVQDFGEISAGQKTASNFNIHDIAYVSFDPLLSISPGDKFSIYVSRGLVEHPQSEREGYRYSIKGHLEVRGKKNDLWECEITHTFDRITRHDRITTFTPKIEKLLTTYNPKKIEAVIMASYEQNRKLFSFGDVVYLDRGRADGVEIGNIFDVYSFTDHATKERITEDPTYKVGELRVISLSDDFATAIVEGTSRAVSLGQLAVSKTLEQALTERRARMTGQQQKIEQMEREALQELDVELNLDDVGKDLKDQADKIELSEEELEELEREERKKSFLQENESDLEELNRIEKDIEEAESLLDEVSDDQNKKLEQVDLEDLEETLQRPEPDAFESIDEIEEEVGKKYLDEDLNAKSNPYGLTEFDLEEVDELLNTDPLEEVDGEEEAIEDLGDIEEELDSEQ